MQGIVTIRFPSAKSAKKYYDIISKDPILKFDECDDHFLIWNTVSLQYPTMEHAQRVGDDLSNILLRTLKKVRRKVTSEIYVRIIYRRWNEKTEKWDKITTRLK